MALIIDYYGDSTIWGYLQGGARANPTPVSTFASSLTTTQTYTVNNMGVNGQGTRRLLGQGDQANYGGIAPLNTLLQQSQAKYCIFNHCLNDVDPNQEGNSLATYEANLRQIVSLVRSYNKTVIFETPNPTYLFNISSYVAKMRTVASELNVPVIDQNQMLTDYMSANGLTVGSICPDGEHPTQAIYNKKGQYAAQQFKIITEGTGTGTLPKPFAIPNDPRIGNMTFMDEFDGTSLDRAKWALDQIWWNQTPQISNYKVENGSLKIWPVSDFRNRDISTDGSFSQKFGYFEIEAKLPYGKGPWPAFWLYGHPGDDRPEIDIMEAYSGGGVSSGWSDSSLHPINYGITLHKANANYSYHVVPYAKTMTGLGFPPVDLYADFHKYAVLWSKDEISFYFDDKKIGTWLTGGDTYYNKELFILLTLQIGSASGGGDSTTPLGITNSFEVKYCRVWALSDGSTTVTTNLPPPSGSPGAGGGPGTVDNFKNQFHVGMHAHRVGNGGGSSTPQFQYGVFRDWDCDGLHDFTIWKSDGSIDFTTVDAVYASHASRSAKVIKVFGTVPTWASAAPNGSASDRSSPSFSPYGVVGSSAGPANLDAYEDYVMRFVQRMQQYLWAVEGWNEPYPNTANPLDSEWPQYFTGNPTLLADMQKRIYRATKAVNPNILVFSPANAYVNGINNAILDAKTSEGEPITNFFDVLAWHAYNRSANGEAGPTLAGEAATVKSFLTTRGLDKPLADTEHGWIGAPKEGGSAFYAMSDSQQADVLYNMLVAAKNASLLCVCLYSYDDELIGGVMGSTILQSRLQKAYTDLDTKSYPTGGSTVGGGGDTTTNFGTYQIGDALSVKYDGSKVEYRKNGVLMRVAPITQPNSFFMDSSFRDVGAKLKSIRFTPLGSNNWADIGGEGKPEDYATKGATFGKDIFGQITPSNAGTYIANAAISNALIGNYIESASYVPGVSGWHIDKTGNTEFNNGTFRGTLGVNIVSAANIISKSATNFETVTRAAPNGTQTFSFYMDYTGVAGIVVNVQYAFTDADPATTVSSGSLWIDSQSPANISSNGFLTSGFAMQTGSLLSAGWHTFSVSVNHNFNVGNHSIYALVLRSYR